MFAHVDADAFFASVLLRRNPGLKGKPLIAAGMGGGCVIAASYEAKALGVKTGMPIKEAKKLLPRDCIITDTDFAESHTASHQIEEILRRHCSDIEMMSVDEWFLDLHGVTGGIPTDLFAWAADVQKEVLARTALGVSFGIAPTKLLAKMGSPYRKPYGIAVITTDPAMQGANIFPLRAFLQSLPAEEIPGVGWRRSVHTAALGLKTALDVALADPELIRKVFGRPGNEMQQELLGTPVHRVNGEPDPPKSVSRCRSFRPTRDRDFVTSQILTHLAYMVLKMRRHDFGCTHLGVWLRDGEYHHHALEAKLPQLFTTEEQLVPYARDLTKRLQRDTAVCTQAGLVLSGLHDAATTQYSLFDDTNYVDRGEGLQRTLDCLREKFGRDSVRRGAAMPTEKYKRRMLAYEE